MMLVWTPSLVMLAWVLWREQNDFDTAKELLEQKDRPRAVSL
jgi:hypothetical protein